MLNHINRLASLYTGQVSKIGLRLPLYQLAAVLRSRPLVWLGAVSYGIYLVNEPTQKVLGLALALIAQGNAMLFTALWLPGAIVFPIVAAWALHVWIEAPTLRWGRTLARRGMKAATVPVSVG